MVLISLFFSSVQASSYQYGPALDGQKTIKIIFDVNIGEPEKLLLRMQLGSQYLACYRDADNDFLTGDSIYKLHLPKGIPAKNFWSVTAYHPDTRSLLQNANPKPSISSYDKPDVNPDGSVDVWFAPKTPRGKEKNWIKTLPGEGWFILVRLYGPLEPDFDEDWKPDDIVKVN